ncbi:MAG: hypothetical protein JAY74_24080 [Candidatus Thiodiazotropha taylori]|nr:hypothetical protein [Candidatus Thiodiazotropha taylori]
MNRICWTDDWFYHCNSCGESEDEIFDCISRGINAIWRSKWWSSNIVDDNSQLKLIHAMQQRYVYPNYLDLVGKPSNDDYISDGVLTVFRKAELLLIGEFEWNGLIIAKHQSALGFSYDYGEKTPKWSIDDEGWYVSPNHLPDPLSYSSFFTPFRNKERLKLVDVIYQLKSQLEDNHCILPIDGNVFNCMPENLASINRRGRPKRCVKCGRRVSDQSSRIIRVRGSKLRYCIVCLDGTSVMKM